MSSLRGLTHVLTCEESVETPFTIIIPPSGQPTILSAQTIQPGQEQGHCGGLLLNMRVGSAGDQRLRVTLPITNQTEHAWRGSVQLQLGGVSFPVDIGSVDAGATRSDSVTLRVSEGTTEIQGSLLIGP